MGPNGRNNPIFSVIGLTGGDPVNKLGEMILPKLTKIGSNIATAASAVGTTIDSGVAVGCSVEQVFIPQGEEPPDIQDYLPNR